MLNHIVLMGRLTRDPELRRTGSGVAVASFTLAVDRDFAAQGAEKETDFIDVVAWRNTADFVSKYFSKGRMAVVSGRLQIRNWEDKEGNKRRTAEILAENIYFGDSKKEDDGGSVSAPMQGSTQGFGAPALELLAQTGREVGLPTVSEITTSRVSLTVRRRVVVSRVSNRRLLAGIPAPVMALSSVDLPALV